MNRRLRVIWWVFVMVMVAAAQEAWAQPPSRLGPPQCTRILVKSGDTAWGVAYRNRIGWDRFVAMNFYIEDLSKIWPADELTIWCPDEFFKVDIGTAVTVNAPPTTRATTTTAASTTTVPPAVMIPAAIPPPTSKPPPTTVLAAPVTEPGPALAVVAEVPSLECMAVPGKFRWDGSPMCVLSAAAIAWYLRGAGFTGDGLVVQTAVCMSESGSDPRAHGDREITDETWWHAIGLCQVRSVKRQKGTGGPRDQDRLEDPAFNADSAWRISAGGTDFSHWSDFKNGNYRKYLRAAEAAVRG